MEKAPAQHEQVSFDELGKALQQFEVENLFYYTLMATRDAHDNREKSPLSDEEFAEWAERCPRPDDEAITPLEEQYQESRQSLANRFQIDVDMIDKLHAAHKSEQLRRERPVRNEENRPWGMPIEFMRTPIWFTEGVITLANLTGETYTISNVGWHVGPTEEMYSYQVQPGQAIEEIFPDQPV